MSNNFLLWNTTNNVEIIGEFNNESIFKAANIGKHVYLLTINCNLIHGVVKEIEDHQKLQLEQHEALKFRDIASCGDYLYVVDLEGRVFKCDENLETVNEVTLIEESKTCSHGHSTIKFKMKVEKIAIGEFGTLFVTDTGQLWASGVMPQIGINSTIPKRVTFFENRFSHSVSIGNDFAIVIVSKQVKSEDTDSDECDEDVFVPNCPHCMSISPNSQNYNICPLNLTVKSDNTDSTSTSSKNDSTSTTSNDRSKCVHYDHTPELTESSECSEKIEKNIIFRNTEAARDFLTRQFSWMSSAGEEYLAECTEKPTRIIKENVTNMASLVYEGVKTVGDKVVTLSRHVSGSSDNCDVLEMAEDISLPRITSKDEFMWSLSQGTSERDLSEHGIQERCNIVTRNGSNLLNCEVWTWGNVTHGQLGIGDNIKRERPMIITKLSNVGARKASVQGSHAAVLTLDGRAYLWGRNDYNQVTIDSTVDQSSPRLFIINSEERVRDIACGLYQTLLISSKFNVMYIGRKDSPEKEKVVKLYTSVPDIDDKQHLHVNNNKHFKLRTNILITSQFSIMNKSSCSNEFILDFTISEQQYLDEILLVHSNVIKTMSKKNITNSDSSVYEQLMESYSELLYFTAANVQSLLESINGLISEMDITMFKYIEEHLHIYKKYLRAVNDIISLGAFSYISKAIDISSTLNRIKSKKDKSNSEQIVFSALTLPLQRLNSYPALIRNILPFLIKKDQRLQEILTKWTTVIDEQHQKQSEAEKTKEFWLNSGKTIEQFRSPNRRLVRESHKHPIQLQNAGRFSSHWFILLTDILVHVNGSTPHIHDLTVVWVEPPNDDTYSQNQISLRMPEEVLVLCTTESELKAEWLQALQNAIKAVLNKTNGIQPPTVRSAEYTFYKTGFYKDGKYKGRWSNGKMHGSGKLEWSDGRIYTGQFSNNQIHGFGRMEIPNVGVYEGLWKDNQQNGFGILKYSNGDIYKGYFKDGVPNGHGSLKHGNFMASTASIYIGDWVLGNKNGYGVIDDIVTGEKYLGTWSDNKKHGSGLIVTSDGIYYEGTFNQDVFTGHGLMILEDGTHYEGDFKGTGNLSGKGTLTLNSGHTIEGNLSGSLIDGIKISSGILNLTKNNNVEYCVRPSSFGKLCTPVGHKWKALFRQCYQMLGVPESNPKTNHKVPDTQKIWQNIAVLISNSHQGSLKKKKTDRSLENSINNLDTIPKFGRNKIDVDNYAEIKQYLSKAFESPHHPLGSLLADLNVAYTTTYGGLRAHPLLLTHAVAELHSITKRLYDIIKMLFPALPPYEKEIPLENCDESEVISYQNLLYPIILPKIHLPLFILYTLHNKPQEIQYWKRLMEWNKHSDFTLMAFLSVDQKFLANQGQDQATFLPSPVKDQTFLEAIETLQLLKTTFSPIEKLLIIRQTFEKMTEVVQVQLGHDYKWSMDDLFPAFLYVVVRARILQLGSELHFIEDFMQPSLENGELGIMFTTLKACYQQILQEKTSIN